MPNQKKRETYLFFIYNILLYINFDNYAVVEMLFSVFSI